MGTGTYITKRNGSANFYARILVPEDLRERFGRTEIWQSLRTPDRKEAMRRSAPVFAKQLGEFDAMRRTRPATEADLQQAAFDHYTSELSYDSLGRADMARRLREEQAEHSRIRDEIKGGATPHLGHLLDHAMVADPVGFDRGQRALRRKLIADDLARGQTINVHWAADAFIAREGLAIAKGSPDYVKLCQGYQRAELEFLKRAEERDQGDWGGQPSDPMVTPVAASQKPLTAKPGETIPELFEAFYRENAGDVREDTWAQNRMAVGLFVEYLGRSAHVSAITSRSISAWKQQLLLWPVKAAEINEFKGLGFKEIIAKNATLKKRTITGKTVNRYLSGLGKFCRWLKTSGLLDYNPMTAGVEASSAEGKTIADLVRQTDAATEAEKKHKEALDASKKAADAIGESLEKSVEGMLLDSKRLSDVFASLAKELEQMALKAVLTGNGPFGGVLSSATGTSGGLFGGIAHLLGFATGGEINGPGSGTSDSILARVSKGEFVVNAESAQKNLGLLHALNGTGPVPRFASGGQVGAVAMPSFASTASSASHTFKIDAPITVNANGGTPEQNADLAAKMQAQMTETMKKTVVGEIAKQMRP